MVQTSKTENFEKVRKIVKELDRDSFTNHDIVKSTNLNYEQVKKFLSSLEELEEVKYLESTKIYVRC